MITIHKFKIQRQFSQILEIPGGIVNGVCDPMRVAVQDGHICLWKLVDTEKADTQKLEIRTYGTGQEITPDIVRFVFLGTVMDGIYVWHVYARLVN